MVKNFINNTYFFERDEATTAAYFKRIIWAEYDRVGLTDIMEAKESPELPIGRPRPIIKIAET